MNRFVILILGLVALTAIVPAGAAADAPEPVTIDLHGILTGPSSIAGTWTASGAITDSGTYSETIALRGSTVHVVKQLESQLGTIVLSARAVLVWTSPTRAVFHAGQWRFVSGTGAYESLKGGGSPAAEGFVDLELGTISLTHTGLAHG